MDADEGRMDMTIKEERTRAGLTQAEAAKLLHVSKRAIEEWEAGKRNPKKPEAEIVEMYRIVGIFTGDGREAILSGELSIDEARDIYKIETAKKLSKWGRYPSTFEAIWNSIPESSFEMLSAEALAELVDAMKAVYDKGKFDGKHENE